MIKGKRAFLAKILYRTRAYLRVPYFSPGSLVIFNYHRIKPPGTGTFPFDDGVFGPDQEALRDHFKCLKENADVISEQELLEHVQSHRKLPKSCAMVTFDDGYRDNIDLALPIIQEQGIPALFFIPTQLIESRELGWWDSIAFLLKKTRSPVISIRGTTFDLSTNRAHAISELQSWMKHLKIGQTETLVDEISQACGVDVPSFELTTNELMTWEQIREAKKKGITIGSHTHSHRVMSTLPHSEQMEELRVSKQILERELEVQIKSVAYPVGGVRDYNRETEKFAKSAGYELGFSFQTGGNRLDQMSPFSVSRISAEENISLTYAAVTFPSIFARKVIPK